MTKLLHAPCSCHQGNIFWWIYLSFTKQAEGLFAAANIFSTLKLVHLFSINPHLGPLQISLGRMVIDIIKFFFIYTLVLFAFACGKQKSLHDISPFAFPNDSKFLLFPCPIDVRKLHNRPQSVAVVLCWFREGRMLQLAERRSGLG